MYVSHMFKSNPEAVMIMYSFLSVVESVRVGRMFKSVC